MSLGFPLVILLVFSLVFSRLGCDSAKGLTFDLSKIDMEKLRDEFAKKVRHKATALYTSLPTPPFTAAEKEAVADKIYAHVWQQAVSGEFVRVA